MTTAEHASKLHWNREAREDLKREAQAVVDGHEAPHCALRKFAVLTLLHLGADEWKLAAAAWLDIRCIRTVDSHAACIVQRPQSIPQWARTLPPV